MIIQQFFEHIKLYKSISRSLKSGCSSDDIKKLNRLIKRGITDEVKELYETHNGQYIDERGIFKCMSGYSKTSYLKYLNIKQVIELYQKLVHENEYSTIFKDTYLPIATNNIECPDDVLCIDCKTGKVILLWVLIYDYFNPVEWQIQQKVVAESIDEYIRFQISIY